MTSERRRAQLTKTNLVTGVHQDAGVERRSRGTQGKGEEDEDGLVAPGLSPEDDTINALTIIPRATLFMVDEAFQVLDAGLVGVVATTSKISGGVADKTSNLGKLKSAVKTVNLKYELRKAQQTTHNMAQSVEEEKKEKTKDGWSKHDSLPALIPGAVADDRDFLNWAMDSVSVPEEKGASIELSPQFQENMKHKMLCWDVFHGERHKAPNRPKKGTPSNRFTDAAQNLFGLRSFLSVHQRRRSCWGGSKDARQDPWKSSFSQDSWMNSTQSSSSSWMNSTSDLSKNFSCKSMGSTAESFMSKSMTSIAPTEQEQLDAWETSLLEDGIDCSLWQEEPLWNDEAQGLKTTRLPSLGQTRDVCPGASLRQPPPFVEPHRNLMIQDTQHTAEFVYYRHCDTASRVPLSSVWRRFGEGFVDASAKAVTDPDLQVITDTVLECATEGKRTKSIDASSNQITDEGFHGFVKGLLENKSAGDSLQSLSFANNPIAMQSVPLILDFSLAVRGLPNLISLNLSGILLCDTRQGNSSCKVVTLICNALTQHKKLQVLNLSNTGIGRYSQEACVSVGKLMGTSPDLSKVDLSWNFFRHDGFQAIATALKHSKLTFLSLARNSGVPGKTQFQQYNPIQLLCEGLLYNNTMEVLDVSETGCGSDSAFVIEDAITSHPNMRKLDISGNPLGGSGLRALLRMLIGGHSKFEECNVQNNREQANNSSSNVRFRYAHPDGSYRLNLSYPHQRANLRVLLKLSEKVRDRELCFRQFKLDGKPCRVPVEKDKVTNQFIVPTHGICCFSFSMAASRLDRGGRASADRGVRGDAKELLKLLRDARIHVSALRYPIVRTMFEQLITVDQQKRFIHACSKDLLFNHAQVSQLCKDRPEVAVTIVSALFPSVEGKSSQLMLLSCLSDRWAPVLAKDVQNCLWFQPMNPTGAYRLDLMTPSDYAVAETCLLVNTWEAELSRAQGRPDTSQKGNYEMLRNETHNEKSFTYGPEWNLPDYGLLTFDYMSSRRPSPGQRPMSEVNCLTMIETLRRSTASEESKLKAIRSVSVRIYVSSSQLRTLLAIVESQISKRELFCVLFTRVTDLGKLLSTEILHNDKIFTAEDRTILLSRLGHLSLFNVMAPESVRYHCLLSVYEQRSVVDCLVKLSVKEPGINFHDAMLNGSQCVVPATWAENHVPIINHVFECVYQGTTTCIAARKSLAERYCGWSFD